MAVRITGNAAHVRIVKVAHSAAFSARIHGVAIIGSVREITPSAARATFHFTFTVAGGANTTFECNHDLLRERVGCQGD